MEKEGENNYYKCQLLFLLLPPGLRWALSFGITSVPWADRLQSSSKDSYIWPIRLLPHRSLLHYAAKSLQSCPTLCNPIDGSHQAPPSWDFPGKNTGVGCYFLLQCMKVKSESEVAQSCPTLSDPMDCSLPGSSIHGIFHGCSGVGCHRLLETGGNGSSVL